MWRWHWLLWHCHWSVTRRYINARYIYNLPRSCTMDINWSIKKNGFILKKTRSWWYSTKTMTDADYADDLALLLNTPTQAKSLPHHLEQTVGGICLHMNKTEFICFKQKEPSPILSGKSLKLVNHFTNLGNNISSTESDIYIHLVR